MDRPAGGYRHAGILDGHRVADEGAVGDSQDRVGFREDPAAAAGNWVNLATREAAACQ